MRIRNTEKYPTMRYLFKNNNNNRRNKKEILIESNSSYS